MKNSVRYFFSFSVICPMWLKVQKKLVNILIRLGRGHWVKILFLSLVSAFKKRQEKTVYACIISSTPQFLSKTTTGLWALLCSFFLVIICWDPSSSSPKSWHIKFKLSHKSLWSATNWGKQIPRCLYAGDNSWRLKELVVQLAVKVACPLLGPGDWWGLPPQHRGVLWERVKSMRSVRRRRLRVPESEPQG